MFVIQLIACPVEQLGIELPEGGVEAISHEDLRRDTRNFLERPESFVERLGQMQFVAAAAPASLPEGSQCAARGEGPERVWLAPWPASADEATGAAALVSMAKAWDLSGAPPGRRLLCRLPRGASLADTVAAGGGDTFGVSSIAEGELREVGRVYQADTVDVSRPPERVNYTQVQARVKLIFPKG